MMLFLHDKLLLCGGTYTFILDIKCRCDSEKSSGIFFIKCFLKPIDNFLVFIMFINISFLKKKKIVYR